MHVPQTPSFRGVSSRLLTLLVTLSALAALAVLAPTAGAFMTWNTPGNAEHERITRLGLACNSGADIDVPTNSDREFFFFEELCLKSLTPWRIDDPRLAWKAERPLRMIAGADGYFGGAGAPDRLAEVLDSSDSAHCDNGDFWFGASSYPMSLGSRTNALMNCLRLYQSYLTLAVERAGRLVDANGRLNAGQADITDDCNVAYDPALNPTATHSRGQAKCDLLIAYGRAMHLVEDFFSHSNWVDANPATASLTNPPGLGNDITNVPDGLRFPRSDAELMTFLQSSEVISGGYPKPWGAVTRIYHDYALTKDEGDGKIDWKAGTVPKGLSGKTGRGAAGVINGQDNFQKAVRAAAYAVRTSWVDFYNQIKATYPGTRGDLVWNAIRTTTPWSGCPEVTGAANRAQSPPTGGTSAQRTVRVQIINRAGVNAVCWELDLAFGEWGSMPADEIAGDGGRSSFITLSNGTDTEGRAKYNLFDLWWNNPLIGSNNYSCKPTQGYACSISGGKGNDSSITVTVTRAGNSAAKSLARQNDKAPAPEPDDAQAPQTVEQLNVKVSKSDYQNLLERVNRMYTCSGTLAERAELRVEDISCARAIKLLSGASRQYTRFCPVGWTMLSDEAFVKSRNPYWQSQRQKIERLVPEGMIICHDDTRGTLEDEQSRSLRYELPHAGDHND